MSNINTIRGFIDTIRESIKQTSDDSTYTDEYIYSIALPIRNELMYMDLKRNKLISKHLFKTMCMPLELSSDIPCDCLPCGLPGCTVLKGKYKLPQPFKTASYTLMHVTSLNGSVEYSFKEVRFGKFNSSKRTNQDKAYYTIYNEYLYLIGHHSTNTRTPIPAILINMILVDPSEADEITLCDKDGKESNDTCFNPLVDTFQIEGHLTNSLREMTLKALGIPIAVPEDMSNNANSVPLEKSY